MKTQHWVILGILTLFLLAVAYLYFFDPEVLYRFQEGYSGPGGPFVNVP